MLPVLSGCSGAVAETDITLDLPQPGEQLVVEGNIESGLPPFVITHLYHRIFGMWTFLP